MSKGYRPHLFQIVEDKKTGNLLSIDHIGLMKQIEAKQSSSLASRPHRGLVSKASAGGQAEKMPTDQWTPLVSKASFSDEAFLEKVVSPFFKANQKSGLVTDGAAERSGVPPDIMYIACEVMMKYHVELQQLPGFWKLAQVLLTPAPGSKTIPDKHWSVFENLCKDYYGEFRGKGQEYLEKEFQNMERFDLAKRTENGDFLIHFVDKSKPSQPNTALL